MFKLAESIKVEVSEAVEIIKRELYVDDILTGENIFEIAIKFGNLLIKLGFVFRRISKRFG